MAKTGEQRMKCSICKFYNICKGRLNETVENCARFKSVEQTNEEWFDTLTTKGKAEVIAQLSSYGGNVEAILDWLKEKHEC